jgi:hypothetical protein
MQAVIAPRDAGNHAHAPRRGDPRGRRCGGDWWPFATLSRHQHPARHFRWQIARRRGGRVRQRTSSEDVISRERDRFYRLLR